MVARADVIFADIRQMQLEKTVATLLSGRKQGAELIFLANKEQAETLTLQDGENITDIWITPLTVTEFRFRLIRWQKTYKMSRDLWPGAKLPRYDDQQRSPSNLV